MTSKTIVEEVEAGDLLGSRAENHFIQFTFTLFICLTMKVLTFRTMKVRKCTMAQLALQAGPALSK